MKKRTLLLGAVGGGLATAALLRAFSGPSTDSIAWATVQEGPFDLAIVETGSLQAQKSVTYASSIQSNQAKIVALAPEGKAVAKGDVLILFDTTQFEEDIRESEAQLAAALAESVKTRQDLALQQVQNGEELAAARQKESASALEMRDVEEGKGKLREEEARADLAEAERLLKRTRTARDDLKPLLTEGFITRQEMERAEQEAEKAAEKLALAKQRHDSLLEYGRPLEKSQAQAEALASRESLKALTAAMAARLEQRRAAIEGTDSRIRAARSKLANAQAQLAKCEIRADVAGIVVYRPVFFGSEARKPQVGDQVWANQPLLILPDVSHMTVDARVRETDVHKVANNQAVRVRVAAYPDLRLTGKVSLVGTLAEEDPARRTAKYFGITVDINERDDRLRPGMSATIEIQVERKDRAVFVPIQSVFERGGKRIVYRRTLAGFEATDVVTGSANRDFVVIESGLKAGDRVALSDPNLAEASEDRR